MISYEMNDPRFRIWQEGQPGTMYYFGLSARDILTMRSKFGSLQNRRPNVMQFTGLKDSTDPAQELWVGDIIKRPTNTNQTLHGAYAYYEIISRGMIPLMSYLCSEKETKMYRGYLFTLLTSDFDIEQIEFGKEATAEYIRKVGNIYENPVVEVDGVVVSIKGIMENRQGSGN